MSSLDSPKAFKQYVLEAVDGALSVLGGESVTKAFYYHLERRTNLTRHEIPCKLEAFHEALSELFGDGSAILEGRICRNLYKALGLEYSLINGKTLTAYVKEVFLKREAIQ